MKHVRRGKARIREGPAEAAVDQHHVAVPQSRLSPLHCQHVLSQLHRLARSVRVPGYTVSVPRPASLACCLGPAMYWCHRSRPARPAGLEALLQLVGPQRGV